MEARPTAPLMPISPPPYPARPGPLRGPTDLTYTGLLMEVRVGEGVGGEGPGAAGFLLPASRRRRLPLRRQYPQRVPARVEIAPRGVAHPVRGNRRDHLVEAQDVLRV